MRASALTALPLLITLLACGPAPEALGPGDVTIPWAVPPQGCEAASVDEVEITLASPQATLTERRPCAVGLVELADVPFGRYTLSARGLSRGAHVHASPEATLIVRPDAATAAPTAILAARPAALDVSWSLDAASCEAARVDSILIGIYDALGAPIRTLTAPCAQAGALLQELPAGSWTLGLTSLPAGPAAHAPITLKRGQRARHAITLQ